MAKEQKVYMPLMIGDWLKGTRGMRADVRGVYLNLLLYQWDNGFIPSDWEELCLIDPEIPKVWDKIKSKFAEIAPGKLQNKKNEEVRDFWKKQSSNGKKGGRPKKENPKVNPDNNPKQNPNHKLHNDIDLDNDLDLKNKKESDEIFDFTKPDITGDLVIFPIDTPPMRGLWAAWKKTRWHNHRLRYKMFGEQAALKQLDGMDFHKVSETINKAIEAGWQNLYPDGKGTNGTGKTKVGNSKADQRTTTRDYLANHYGNKPNGK